MDAMFFIVLGATLASFLLTLLFGRFVIPMLRALHAGQSIREVGPQWHNTKAGTPTMGGIMFIAAIILCTVGFGWKSMTENHTYTLFSTRGSVTSSGASVNRSVVVMPILLAWRGSP